MFLLAQTYFTEPTEPISGNNIPWMTDPKAPYPSTWIVKKKGGGKGGGGGGQEYDFAVLFVEEFYNRFAYLSLQAQPIP